jgi:hypothetical protein
MGNNGVNHDSEIVVTMDDITHVLVNNPLFEFQAKCAALIRIVAEQQAVIEKLTAQLSAQEEVYDAEQVPE